jgi:hypothetical protein
MPGMPPPNNDFIPRLLIAIIGAVVGSIGTIGVDRFKNRLLVLKKRISYQLVGMSSLTDTWGDIRITWNGDPVNNLYVFNAEIINNTFKDAPKDMVITFSVEPGCYFLRESGVIRHGDVAMGLNLEKEYFKQFQDIGERWRNLPPEEKTPLAPIHNEIEHITRHKKFVLPILNRRRGSSSFDFLVGSNTPQVPVLAIGIYEPGISMDWHESIEKKKKRKIWSQVLVTAIYIGLTFPIISYSSSITWAAWLMFANTFVATYLGKGLVYLLKLFKII